MNKRSAAKVSFGTKAKEAAARGRSIQANVDRLEANKKRLKSDEAMQAGQRQYPSKFPPQHLTKPGREADLKVRPMFEAPAYLGSEKLKDYRGAERLRGRAPRASLPSDFARFLLFSLVLSYFDAPASFRATAMA